MSGWKFVLALIAVAWGFDNVLNRADAALGRRMGVSHPRLKLTQGFVFIVSTMVIIILLGLVPGSVWAALE
jgi:hypothetical protein